MPNANSTSTLLPNAVVAAAAEKAQIEARIREDLMICWMVFAISVVFLMGFSALLLDPAGGAGMSAGSALRRCMFWCASGCAFSVFVWCHLGNTHAVSWLIGYTLEYALSFDNLFLFHMVFSSYGTPPGQVFRGIVTAMRLGIAVRLALFFVSEEVFNLTFLFRWVFGAILVYSGVKVIFIDEDEENPTDNCLVRLVTRYLPVHHDYVDGSAFFVYCAEHSTVPKGPARAVELGRAEEALDGQVVKNSFSNPSAPQSFMCCRGYKATPLLLAVITLMIIDAVFAVDSVTAKVSMIDQYDERMNFFLNFSSTAFAMLCMPSLYFIIVLLVNLFRFLKYGLGGILILIGLKLLVSEHIHVREDVSGMVLLSILGLSVLGSVLVAPDEPEMEESKATAKIEDGDGNYLMSEEVH